MSPILGIIASSKFVAAGDFESIATVTVGSGGSAGPITFSSIPSTYTHLQLRYITRSASALDALQFRFNSDTGSNYARHRLQGDGSSVTAAAASSATYAASADFPTTTSTFGAGVIDILDYANTNKYKTVRLLAGYDANGSGLIDLRSNLWMSTSAITQIDFISGNSTNFAQYSTFALYGCKSA